MFLQVSSALIIKVPSGSGSPKRLVFDNDTLVPPIRVSIVLTELANNETGSEDVRFG
jgi:hypothetical protein